MRVTEAENVPDRGDVFLNALGLTILERQVPTGETIYRIEGDTHPYRHALRELGGRWDKIEQCWVFTGRDPRSALVGKLGAPTASGGMSDSAMLPLLTNRPS